MQITAKQLLAYFRKAVDEKWGYVWSLNGELYSRQLAQQYHDRKRSTSSHRNPATYWLQDCARWIGKMAADCSGGIVGAFRSVHPTYGDRTANTFYNQCAEKGKIATIPETPGLCVWRDGHIGIYEGNGNVLEFRGTEYGAVRTRLKDRTFTHWGRLRDVDYAETPSQEKGGTGMNLKKLILVNNACYKAGRTIAVKGIMVHSTGANNPNLKRYVGPDDGLLGKNQYNNHWNQDKPGGRQVCVHAFIGLLADGTVATYQTLPWNHRGWHGGSGSKGSVNDTHIGFEICEDGLTDRAYFDKVYKEAVELCAYLCKEYSLNPTADGVIIGHFEGHKRGIASNHGDPHNWFPKHGKSMDTFRADVAKAMGGSTTTPQQPAPATPSGLTLKVGDIVQFAGGGVHTSANAAKPAHERGASRCKVTQVYNGKHPYHLVSEDGGKVHGWVDASSVTAAAAPVASFTPYRVRVTATNLNIRKGAGTAYPVVGSIKDKGIYTIVDEASGAGAAKWGKLKSGAGWISLDHTTKA